MKVLMFLRGPHPKANHDLGKKRHDPPLPEIRLGIEPQTPRLVALGAEEHVGQAGRRKGRRRGPGCDAAVGVGGAGEGLGGGG